jgi:DNA-binding NarL/FixJ family response regulator
LSEGSIKLALACEYALDREAICKILTSEKDIKVVAQVSRPEEIKKLILGQIKAELLILDMDMGGLNLLETLSLIKRKKPGLGVLLLTIGYDEEKIIEAICAGSLGYILKTADAQELIKSVRALINGEVWIQRKMMAKVISRLSLSVKDPIARI